MNTSSISKIFTFLIAVSLSISAIAQESYLLNYDDVELRKITQDIAKFSKKTIILDPRVKGRVTIYSDSLWIKNRFGRFI